VAIAAGAALAQSPARLGDPSLAPKLSEVEQKIETALAKKVKVSYRDTPLSDLVADLEKQADITISLDEARLAAAGTEPTTPVTFALENVTLRLALDQLLGPRHLLLRQRATRLEITSQDMRDEPMVVRVYPVRDLIHARDLFWDDLDDNITAHLSPDSWYDNGGQGKIGTYGGCLTISQTRSEHRRIAQLLSALRQMRREQARVKPGEVGPVIDATVSPELRKALAQRESRKFDGKLNACLDEMSKTLRIPILLDAQGLDEAGIKADQPIQVAYQNARADDALRDVLAPLHLATMLQEECLLVTSEEKAAESRITRIYPIYDLAHEEEKKVTWQFTEAEILVDRIEETIGGETWTTYGGESAISQWSDPPAVLVTAPDDVQREVEAFLASLRSAGAAEFNARQRQADKDNLVQRVYPLYRKRYALRAAMIGKTGLPAGVENEEFNELIRWSGWQGGAANVGDPIPTAEEVAKLIRELLPDDSWKEKGVSLRPFHDMLIVRQRGPMHARIRDLLISLDAWSGHADPPQQGQTHQE